MAESLDPVTMKPLLRVNGFAEVYYAEMNIHVNNPKQCNRVSLVVRGIVEPTDPKSMGIIAYRLMSSLSHIINGEAKRFARTWSEFPPFIKMKDSWAEYFICWHCKCQCKSERLLTAERRLAIVLGILILSRLSTPSCLVKKVHQMIQTLCCQTNKFCLTKSYMIWDGVGTSCLINGG